MLLKKGLCKMLAFITGEAVTHSDFYLEIVARRDFPVAVFFFLFFLCYFHFQSNCFECHVRNPSSEYTDISPLCGYYNDENLAFLWDLEVMVEPTTSLEHCEDTRLHATLLHCDISVCLGWRMLQAEDQP